MRKKKLPPSPGLPCIHVTIPKRGKEIRAQIVEPHTKKVFWKKNYPVGTDIETIMDEARRFKPVRRVSEPEFNKVCLPIAPLKMVA